MFLKNYTSVLVLLDFLLYVVLRRNLLNHFNLESPCDRRCLGWRWVNVVTSKVKQAMVGQAGVVARYQKMNRFIFPRYYLLCSRLE